MESGIWNLEKGMVVFGFRTKPPTVPLGGGLEGRASYIGAPPRLILSRDDRVMHTAAVVLFYVTFLRGAIETG